MVTVLAVALVWAVTTRREAADPPVRQTPLMAPADLPRDAPPAATPSEPASDETPPAVVAAAAPAAPSAALEDVIAEVLPAVVVVQTAQGTGSGFFVRSDAAITSAHVVAGETVVTLVSGTGERTAARVDAVDARADLALLRTTTTPPPRHVLRLGSAANAKVGQQVFVVGSPLGAFSNTVTRGIVSALRTFDGVDFVQTDAAINPGNSGGPVLNASGEVVAVATGKHFGGESLGFAVAIDHAGALLGGGGMPASAMRAAPPSAPRQAAQTPPEQVELAEAEARRAHGMAQLEANLKVIAEAADRVDAEWRRRPPACFKTGAAVRSGDRPWFPLVNGPAGVIDETIPECAYVASSLRDYVDQIADGMRESLDQARRSGVYPGVQRQLLRQYRLGWDGWSR